VPERAPPPAGSAGFDPRALRDALGCFATGVVIVTVPRPEGEPAALTVSSFNTVSLDPPLVLFSVSRDAPSLAALRAADRHGISVLREDQHHLSRRFSHALGRKWEGIAPRLGPAGCPLIGPSLASFECARFATHDGGDHMIFVSRVLGFETADDGAPLLFFRGRYHALSDRIADQEGT
jgi:flavin reductase (DIM6/NTAB) family NADH-FMN oxidoreductase RutF